MDEVASQIKHWKQQYKDVIKVQSDEEIAYFKKPTLSIMDRYTVMKEEGNVYEALEYLFYQCVLEQKEYEDEFVLSAGKSLIRQSTIDKTHTISSQTGKDEIKKSAALVRHYFHIDPYDLPIDEFYKLVSEALWLQEHKNKQLEVTLATILVRTFANSTV